MAQKITAGDLLKQMEVGDYMKLEDGDNTFRVLGDSITGVEYWVVSKGDDGKEIRKPKRLRVDEEIDISEISTKEGGGLDLKVFKSMPVYNYKYKKIQILSVNQKSVLEKLNKLELNPKWGDTQTYNITITKDGQGMETRYEVMPEPSSVKEEEALQDVRIAYEKMNADLNKLFSSKEFPNGGHPLKA